MIFFMNKNELCFQIELNCSIHTHFNTDPSVVKDIHHIIKSYWNPHCVVLIYIRSTKCNSYVSTHYYISIRWIHPENDRGVEQPVFDVHVTIYVGPMRYTWKLVTWIYSNLKYVLLKSTIMMVVIYFINPLISKVNTK